MLTERLRTLERVGIIYRHQHPTVPPKVTYGLTKEGSDLTSILDQLNTLARQWQDQQEPEGQETNQQPTPAETNKAVLPLSF